MLSYVKYVVSEDLNSNICLNALDRNVIWPEFAKTEISIHVTEKYSMWKVIEKKIRNVLRVFFFFCEATFEFFVYLVIILGTNSEKNESLCKL